MQRRSCSWCAPAAPATHRGPARPRAWRCARARHKHGAHSAPAVALSAARLASACQPCCCVAADDRRTCSARCHASNHGYMACRHCSSQSTQAPAVRRGVSLGASIRVGACCRRRVRHAALSQGGLRCKQRTSAGGPSQAAADSHHAASSTVRVAAAWPNGSDIVPCMSAAHAAWVPSAPAAADVSLAAAWYA